jgi:hypothetical protein
MQALEEAVSAHSSWADGQAIVDKFEDMARDLADNAAK